MFEVIEKILIGLLDVCTIRIFGESLASNFEGRIKFVSLDNRPCQAAIIFVVFWEFLTFYQIFLSPKVKRCAIITHRHGMYDLPHKLPNDLRLKILGN